MYYVGCLSRNTRKTECGASTFLTRLVVRAAPFALLILLAPLGALAQAAPAEPKYAFCSGTVVDLNADSITVRRTLAGREYEERRFVINAETKVEGTLKVDGRVTVGFVKTEEGEIARRILVRRRRSP